MPLILTDVALKSADQMKIGWSLVVCLDAKEQVINGKPVTIIEFEGLQGPGNSDENKGRQIAHFIYHAAITGPRPVPEVVSGILRMLAAFEGATVDEIKDSIRGEEINFKRLAGNKIYIEVVDEVYDGKTRKKIVSFSPSSVVPF